MSEYETITVTLRRDDAERLHDLAIAEQVNRDRAEMAAMTNLGSGDWRRIRNVLAMVLQRSRATA